MATSAQTLIRRFSGGGIAFSIAVVVSGCDTPAQSVTPRHLEESYTAESAPPGAPQPVASHEERPTFSQIGIASWYLETGRSKRTADGEKFRATQLTAAHPSLPFGTIARVSSFRNGRSVLVRINDRGPFVRGRIIDVSAAAAERLGIMDDGLSKVRVAVYASDQCGGKSVSALCSSRPTSSQRSHRVRRQSAGLGPADANSKSPPVEAKQFVQSGPSEGEQAAVRPGGP
jgi:rare lipoprotein A